MEQKSLGRFEEIYMDIDEPVNFKKTTITSRNFTVFIGENGAGKSFTFGLIFAGSYVMSNIIIHQLKSQEELINISQFTFDHTFSNQNINGKIRLSYSSGALLEIVFEKGKVVDVNCSKDESINTPLMVTYMSSNFRLFDNIKSYLMMRSLLVAKFGLQQAMNVLLESYKLYDVSYIEKLLLSVPIKIEQSVNKILKESYEFHDDISEIYYDSDAIEFYYTIKDNPDKKVYLTTLSKGHQSILNMLIGQQL